MKSIDSMKDTYTKDEVVDILRGAIEMRARWFYLLLKEAEAKGLDVKALAESAITKHGHMRGESAGINRETASEFLRDLYKGADIGAFDMKVIKDEDEEAIVEFSRCALVDQWKKLGCSDEEIATLCDYASCGDYGMVSKSPKLQIEFPELLSKGGQCCRMIISKKK
ncbi:MAG: L-2-amino-thiazoline-4-carboxylic acid hydrolase [Peptostreptococcales bacterium]